MEIFVLHLNYNERVLLHDFFLLNVNDFQLCRLLLQKMVHHKTNKIESLQNPVFSDNDYFRRIDFYVRKIMDESCKKSLQSVEQFLPRLSKNDESPDWLVMWKVTEWELTQKI